MNVWAVFSVMWRRWFVFLPLLAISLAVAVIIPKDSPPAYTAESIVMLQAPTSQLEQEPGSTTITTVPVNPLTVSNGNLSPVAAILAKVMTSNASANTLYATDFSGTYSVTAPDTHQPLLTVDATAADRTTAIAANHKLFSMMQAEIDRRQAAVVNDPTEKVTLSYVIQDEVSLGIKSKVRAEAILFLAGLLLTFAITVLVDAILARRGRRRAPRARATVAAPEVGIHS